MLDCATQLQQTKRTFFSEISSSRIDRIYASNDVNVVSVRVSPNHFSDHNALIVQVDIPLQASRGKGYWKNNVTCYQNETFLNDLESKWKNWKKKTKQFEPCRVMDSSQKQSKETCDRALGTAQTRKFGYRKQIKTTIRTFSYFIKF